MFEIRASYMQCHIFTNRSTRQAGEGHHYYRDQGQAKTEINDPPAEWQNKS